MSKLLKSKILLGVFVFAVALSFSTVALGADGAITKTLKYGMKDVQVKYLQQTLNAEGFSVAAAGKAGSAGFETTYFGTATKAAVKAFQAAKALVADGIFGPKSRAAVGATVTTTLPAGCASTAGYSSTTGVPCSSGTVVVTPTTGPVSVALATDNPASGSFIAPASGVQFAKYTFTGTGTVTSLKLLRTGVSASTTLSNVYLYDGDVRITDGASIGSDNTVTFNALGGLFTVAGAKTITVVADTLVADYSLGFNLVGYTANGVVTTSNVVGNQMFGASATLATIAMSSATGSGNTDAGTDITVWQGTATVSTRDVLLKKLALRQIGSIVSTDIKNFKLYSDGVLVATVANLDSNGYITFATPYALKTGARTLKVTADVIGGSGRTVQFSLRGAYDILATDTQYNANGTTTGTFPFGPSAFTVNAGTMTVVKTSDSQSANVTLGASDQQLAKYTFTAYGEAIKVETLKVGILQTGAADPTTVSLRNVRILVNGAQVGSNTTVPVAAAFAANSGTQFTTNFVVYPGTPAVVEIHSDIYDNEGTDEIATPGTTAIQAVLVGGAASSNATPQVSLGTINVPSAANVLGNNLTIASGSISVAKTTSYVDQTIAVPQTAYKIGSYQLSGNSTEAVNLNTLYVGWDAGQTGTPATDLSDLYVVYGGTMSPVKGSVSSTALNGNSWSINKTLAKNETIQIDVYATIASSLSTNTIISTMAVAGTTAASGIATYADASGATSLTAGLSGQTITGGSGTLTASKDASSAVAQIVDDSGTIKSLTAKIAAVTDSYTITDMTVTVTAVSAVSTVTLKDHDTGVVVGASKPAATSMTWSGLDYAVPAGTTKKVDVELVLAPVGVGAGTSDSALTTALTAFTARNSAGTSAAGSGSASGSAIYVYKAIPLVSSVALPDSNLAAGVNKTIAKFTVSSNGTGTVAWKQVMFEISKTATPTLASVALYNADTGEAITSAKAFQNGSTGVATTCLGDNVSCELLITVGTNADDDVVEQVSGAKTYEVRATVGGAIAATDSVSVALNKNTATHTGKAAFQTNKNGGGAAAETFIWSDESASATGDTGVTTWNDDYLVKNLPVSWSLN